MKRSKMVEKFTNIITGLSMIVISITVFLVSIALAVYCSNHAEIMSKIIQIIQIIGACITAIAVLLLSEKMGASFWRDI